MKHLFVAAITAILVNQYTTSTGKVCVYQSAYGNHTLNVGTYQACPLTIKV